MPLSPNTLGQSLMAKEAGEKHQSHRVNDDRGKSSVGVHQSGKNLRNQEQQDEAAEEKDESLDATSNDDESLTNQDSRIPPSKRQSSGNKLTSSMKNEDIVTLFKLNNAASRRKYSSPNYASNIAVLHDEKQQPNIVFEKSDSIDDRSISDVNTHSITDSVSPNLFDSKNGASSSLDDYSSTINSSPGDEESSLVNEAASSSSPGDEAFLMQTPSPFTGDLMMYQDQRDAPVYAPLGQRIASSALKTGNKAHPVHSNVSQRLLKILNDSREKKSKQSGRKLKKDNFNDSGDPGGGGDDNQMTGDVAAESTAIESLSLPQGGLMSASSLFESADDQYTADYDPLIEG